MAGKKVTDKVARVIRFLMGLSNPRIAKQMAAYGFTEANLRSGWSLVHGLSRVKADSGAPSDNTTANAAAHAELGAWEKRWFRIARATLAQRYPAIHEAVFLNTSGPEVAFNVLTLIDRIDALGTAKSGFGADGKKAKALLEERGLTKTVLHEGKALLATIGSIDTESPLASFDEEEEAKDKEALEKATSELWSFYIEWSQIARVAVKQRALLRQLGFAPAPRVSSGAADPVTPPAVTPPVVAPPVPASSPAATMSVHH